MSLCLSFDSFTVHSPKSQTHKTRFSSQFIKQNQVKPLPFTSKSRPFNGERNKLVKALTTKPAETAVSASFRNKYPKDINVLVVGSTGYVGKFVVKELVDRGFNVLAIVSERSGIRGKNSKEDTLSDLNGARVCFSDVANLDTLEESMKNIGFPIDVVVSCLASRTGGVKDSWKIDYEATKNSLVAADDDDGFTYSIVRPTAFFKSLGGQVELVKDGKPYVLFGDGKLCACKPISEQDLASFMADCALKEDKINWVLPSPGKALTPLEQGEILFKLLGKEPKFLKVPIGIMDFAIGVLDFLVKIFPAIEDAAEFGKIGRYYAAESMLLLDPETTEYSAAKTPSYGNDTLEEFFARVLREGKAGRELGEQSIF
ncbi:Divinyl chlorophyllide a 8-vinyl-reductase [Hibiscus syriacus]|uniref:Divinyl chlorophyllide a 8-vinyl-reductase n=1 Tax=Hibiscus syriacus TaxID=106335 RepID=A0A6A2ZA11_HIBSY|nr:Divinyl chlorophyllide a 8-vinyl-reductase [Hibiscus syriacus]